MRGNKPGATADEQIQATKVQPKDYSYQLHSNLTLLRQIIVLIIKEKVVPIRSNGQANFPDFPGALSMCMYVQTLHCS